MRGDGEDEELDDEDADEDDCGMSVAPIFGPGWALAALGIMAALVLIVGALVWRLTPLVVEELMKWRW